jgi:hypothetical protein
MTVPACAGAAEGAGGLGRAGLGRRDGRRLCDGVFAINLSYPNSRRKPEGFQRAARIRRVERARIGGSPILRRWIRNL